MDSPFVHLSVNILLKPENIKFGTPIFAGFYRFGAEQKQAEHHIFPPLRKSFGVDP